MKTASPVRLFLTDELAGVGDKDDLAGGDEQRRPAELAWLRRNCWSSSLLGGSIAWPRDGYYIGQDYSRMRSDEGTAVWRAPLHTF